MTDPLTAVDYVYLDRAETRYMEVKELIAAHRDHPATDRHNKRRPGIPGTLKDLNLRVQTLIELGQFTIAANLIETKIRKAYKIRESTP